MDEQSNPVSNTGTVSTPIARGPGKPKGYPKPAGSGRKPGQGNRVTRDVKAAALRKGPSMV